MRCCSSSPEFGDEERNDVLSEWYVGPVLFVTDYGRSVDFCVNHRVHAELAVWGRREGACRAGRSPGLRAHLSSQWPDKVRSGLMFIPLDVDVLHALRAELEGKGVNVKDGYWGYPLRLQPM